MDEPSIDDRLAALKSRRSPGKVKAAEVIESPPSPPVSDSRSTASASRPHDRTEVLKVISTKPAEAAADRQAELGIRRLPTILGQLVPGWSPTRFVIAGASVVSFGSMVAAMGPLGETSDWTDVVWSETSQAALPGQVPSVEIEVNSTAGRILPPTTGAQVQNSQMFQSGLAPSGSPAFPQVSTTSANVAQPSDTQMPAVTPRVDSASNTAPPSTAPPTTAPPASEATTTLAPSTVPAPTPPPTSKASG